MAEALKPPFRADHVGSLLRPQALHDARAKSAKGEISAAELRAIEDKSIRDVVALQESVGLQSITDGEFRRGHYLVDFLTGFEGIVPTNTSYALAFKGEGGASGETRSMLTVTGKVKRTRPVMVDAFMRTKWARDATDAGRPAKRPVPLLAQAAARMVPPPAPDGSPADAS